MKQKYYVVFTLLFLLLGGFFLVKSSAIKQPRQESKQNPSLPKETTVILDKTGFSPKEVTIKIGTAIRWKNVSDDNQTVNSDNYPTNQLHKELNFGIFSNNSSVVYLFTKVGVYGYHNQFHPEQKGKIVVTEK